MAVPGRKFVINLFADSKPAEKAFDNVGKAAGRLPGPVGIATAAIAASFLAVVAVVGKVTKELFDLGEVFNDSFRTIRVGTGATGRRSQSCRTRSVTWRRRCRTIWVTWLRLSLS
jgi:hypothetical protein